ncbi:MAG: hypothetical protein RIM72_22795 [Alphaproteobacteria bacterium]
MQEHIRERVKTRRRETVRPVRVGLRRAPGSLRVSPDAHGIALRRAPAMHPGAAPTTLLSIKRETL